MATYNGERFIRDQVLSILACITDSDEVIVSDDGSTDSTLNILDALAGMHPNIRVVEGPHRGVVANFENALAFARGDIVFLSDQDDVWRSDKVDRVMKEFATQNCDLVVHNARLVDADGDPVGQTLFGLRNSRAGFLKNFARNSYVGCCMAVRRPVLSIALPIPERAEMHDWWIGLVSELWFKTSFVGDELIDYRRHGQNVSALTHHPLAEMVANRARLAVELAKRGLVKRGGK